MRTLLLFLPPYPADDKQTTSVISFYDGAAAADETDSRVAALCLESGEWAPSRDYGSEQAWGQS